MIYFGLVGVFFIFVAKCQLESSIPIAVLSSDLCHHAGACLDDGTGSLFTCRIEDAGHSDFFSNNTFHFLTVFPARLFKTASSALGGFPCSCPGQASILVHRRPFPLTAAAPAKAGSILRGLLFIPDG